MKKLIPLIIFTLFFSSCSGQSIDTSAHPLTIGVDYDAATKLFTESGLFCLPSGEEVRYNVLKTDGITLSQAMEKKSGYSYRSVNYALLGAIALGEGALQNGLEAALFPFLQWSLPTEDILLCACLAAQDIIPSKDLPALLKNSSQEGFLPKASLRECMVALKQGSPIVLPHVINKADGIYISGAVVVQNGVMTAYLDRPATVLRGLLYYKESSGVLTSGGVSVQCRAKRKIDKSKRKIELELSMRLLSHGDPEHFRLSLQKDINSFLSHMTCDIIDCGIAPPFNDITLELTVKPY